MRRGLGEREFLLPVVAADMASYKHRLEHRLVHLPAVGSPARSLRWARSSTPAGCPSETPSALRIRLRDLRQERALVNSFTDAEVNCPDHTGMGRADAVLHLHRLQDQ